VHELLVEAEVGEARGRLGRGGAGHLGKRKRKRKRKEEAKVMRKDSGKNHVRHHGLGEKRRAKGPRS